jgi:hypothetical protein
MGFGTKYVTSLMECTKNAKIGSKMLLAWLKGSSTLQRCTRHRGYILEWGQMKSIEWRFISSAQLTTIKLKKIVNMQSKNLLLKIKLFKWFLQILKYLTLCSWIHFFISISLNFSTTQPGPINQRILVCRSMGSIPTTLNYSFLLMICVSSIAGMQAWNFWQFANWQVATSPIAIGITFRTRKISRSALKARCPCLVASITYPKMRRLERCYTMCADTIEANTMIRIQ